MQKFDRQPTRAPPGFFWGVLGVGLVGALDWLTGIEIRLSILYLLPISLTVWFSGRRAGLLVAVFAAAVWASADIFSRGPYMSAVVLCWNAVMLAGFFIGYAHVLAKLVEQTSALKVEIDERKLAESKTATLARALESSAEMICITDLQNRFTYTNRAFQDEYGFAAGELLGKTPEIIFAPSNAPTLLQEILEHTRAGGWKGELMNKRRDGSEFPIFLTTSQIKDEGGHVTGLIGVALDVTVRKRSEAALRQMAAIVESAEDAIIGTTPDGRIFSWNKAAERAYGYTPEEARDRLISLLISPECQAEFRQAFEQASQRESTGSFETVWQSKDGTRIEVSVNLSPVRDPAGQLTSISAIVRDISERKRLERELAEISEQEQERLAVELHDQLGAYLTGLAFRAKTLAEVLERKGAPEAAHAHQLVQLCNAATEQVRSFSRLLSDNEDEMASLDHALNSLRAEVATLFGAECHIEVSPDLLPLSPEKNRHLYRIAREAARNAIQHGKARTITVSMCQTSRGLELRVRNNGALWVPTTNSRSLGWRLMRYRAGIIGGTLSVESPAGSEVAVVCTVPLPNKHSLT